MSKRGARDSSALAPSPDTTGVTLGRIVRSPIRTPARPTRPSQRRPGRHLACGRRLLRRARRNTDHPAGRHRVYPARDDGDSDAVGLRGDVPRQPDRRRRHEGRAPRRADEDRVADPGRDRDAVRPRCRRQDRRQGRGSQPLSARGRRHSRRREIRRGRCREDRQPRSGPRHRRRQQLQPTRQDRSAS